MLSQKRFSNFKAFLEVSKRGTECDIGKCVTYLLQCLSDQDDCCPDHQLLDQVSTLHDNLVAGSELTISPFKGLAIHKKLIPAVSKMIC